MERLLEKLTTFRCTMSIQVDELAKLRRHCYEIGDYSHYNVVSAKEEAIKSFIKSVDEMIILAKEIIEK